MNTILYINIDKSFFHCYELQSKYKQQFCPKGIIKMSFKKTVSS